MVSKTKRHPKPGLSAPHVLPTSIPVLHPHPRRSQGTGPQSLSPLGMDPHLGDADREAREVFPLGTSSQPDPTQHANTVGIIYQESHKHLQPRPVHFLDY